MEKKVLTLMSISFLALVFFASSASAEVLSQWGLTTDGVPSGVNANLNAGNFIGGPGISAISFEGGDGAWATGWSESTLDQEDYFQITLSPKTGFKLSLSALNFGERRTETGIRNYQVQWSKQADFTSPTTIVTVPVPDDDSERDGSITGLNISVNEGETIYIRWFGYEAESSVGRWRINDGTLNVVGTASQVTQPQGDPEEVTACNLEGNSGDNLNIKRIDFTNEGMSGADPKQFGDDNEWFPLDNIKVEINVENNGDEKIENIEVQWGLYDTESDEWVIELDDEKDFDLKKDKDDTLTISFKLEKALDIDLDQLSDGEHYKFYVIANGYDNEIEKDICTTDFEDISIVVESDFIVLDQIQFQEPVSCGTDLSLTAEVWNIGDQDQEGVYMKIVNPELGIDKTVEVGDIDAFDSKDLNVLLTIPENAQEKSYIIKLTIYDENDDVYVNDYNDDDSIFDIDFKLECSQQQDNAVVSANLVSGGNAGEELVVKATITNTGDSATFSLNAAGYSTWASSAVLDQTSVVLATGESKDVLFTFNVKNDVSGDQTFDIEVLSDNQLVVKQPVSVLIEKTGTKFPGFSGNIINKNNWYLWGIGILNVVLVIIIIAVAVRVARK